MSKINQDMVKSLVKDCKTQEDLFGENGIFKALVKSFVEQALAGEMTEHLGYEKHAASGYNGKNSRNGTSSKTLKGEHGEISVDIPRDRDSEFEPKLIPKNQVRFNGFDEKFISLYARGMSTRDIQAQLKEMYGVEVSPSLISNVTDSVVEEVKTWQNRAPEISRFLGIVIAMYYQDHNPPHFHVRYNEYKAAISINELGLLDGKLPRKVT